MTPTPSRPSLTTRLTSKLPGVAQRRHKGAMIDMLNAFNSRQPERVPKQLFGPDYREAAEMPEFPLDRRLEQLAPPERVQAEIELVREAFPDMEYKVKELVAEGDTVIMIWEFTGTHKGEFFGRRSEGRKANVRGYEVVKFKDGQMVSHYDNHHQTSVEVLGQLGLLDTEVLEAHGLRGDSYPDEPKPPVV
jgi:hypothetical protein